jgi:hypothetical protein
MGIAVRFTMALQHLTRWWIVCNRGARAERAVRAGLGRIDEAVVGADVACCRCAFADAGHAAAYRFE